MSKYARGTTATFEVLFKSPDGNPIVPFDSTYPQITIKDPSGVIQASGVGIQKTTPGEWKFDWAIPAGASLDQSWIAEWDMLSLAQESFKKSVCFELYDQIQAEAALDREGAYLAICGKNERLIYRSETQLYDISVSANYGGSTVWSFDKTQITEVFADGVWNYYVDSPQLTSTGQYLVFWEVQENQISRRDTVVQYLRVAPDLVWSTMPYLRGLIDKLNKVQDTALSYTDSELAQYLERGLGLLNGVHPLTSWVSAAVPSTMVSWWILLSGWWALNARQLLEIEVSHEFTGQSVSLSYEHASPLSDVISRWESLIWERLPPAKVALFRRIAGPGVVAVRPYRLSFENRVYSAGVSDNALSNWPGIIGLLGLAV